MRIKELRRVLGLSQEDMAEKLGTTKRIYGSWERGETPLPFDKAIEIALVFGCTTDDLAGEPSSDLTVLEQNVIYDFRRLSNTGKGFVLDAIEYVMFREGRTSSIANSHYEHHLSCLGGIVTPHIDYSVVSLEDEQEF